MLCSATDSSAFISIVAEILSHENNIIYIGDTSEKTPSECIIITLNFI